MSDVTRILSAIEQGDPAAAEQLLPLVYDELRKLAADRLAQEKPGQTLQAPALVHEAYLRLVDVEQAQRWNSKGHFFAAAAEAMRRILVEQARRKQRVKHGGGRHRVGLEEALNASEGGEDLLGNKGVGSRLDEGSVPLPPGWAAPVNAPQGKADLQAVRRSAVRGAPYGEAGWQQRTAARLGLESGLRLRGRPRDRRGRPSPENDSRPLFFSRRSSTAVRRVARPTTAWGSSWSAFPWRADRQRGRRGGRDGRAPGAKLFHNRGREVC
jgi:ECF sigma factor